MYLEWNRGPTPRALVLPAITRSLEAAPFAVYENLGLVQCPSRAACTRASCPCHPSLFRITDGRVSRAFVPSLRVVHVPRGTIALLNGFT